MKGKLSLAGVAVILATAMSFNLKVAAHHGWADFDRSRKVEISGVVVDSQYENPHCYVKVNAGQDEWIVELSAVPRMKRHGITAEMIKPGTRISLVGHPHKRKAHEMKAVQMILDGKTYDLTL